MTANHRPLEEGDIELIERVRATPCLYDTRDPEFRLVYKKQQQWQSVADGLIMTSWEEARKRWTVLRDRYARELKQLLLHPDSMEYGKSEFFHRMDFLRRFVKKRSIRKKSIINCLERNEDIKRKLKEYEEDDGNKAIPIKIFKVDGNVSSFKSYDQQERKQQEAERKQSFIIEDSQDSTNGKYKYIEQEASDSFTHARDEDATPIEEQCEGEQEYHDYVEDTSVAYEAVDEVHETETHYVANNPMSAPAVSDSNKTGTNISFTNIGDSLTHLPQLQQRPPNNTICTVNSTALREPNDSEEYFSKTIALYLKQLSRRYKIKAKVEMLQILEKYIELEEMKNACNTK